MMTAMTTMNRDCACGPTSVRAGGPIFDVISNLVVSLNELEKTIDEMACAVTPVSCDVPETPSVKEPPPQPVQPMSELERRLDAEIGRVHRSTRNIRTIMDKLRL